jgi:hypothetical protein
MGNRMKHPATVRVNGPDHIEVGSLVKAVVERHFTVERGDHYRRFEFRYMNFRLKQGGVSSPPRNESHIAE